MIFAGWHRGVHPAISICFKNTPKKEKCTEATSLPRLTWKSSPTGVCVYVWRGANSGSNRSTAACLTASLILCIHPSCIFNYIFILYTFSVSILEVDSSVFNL